MSFDQVFESATGMPPFPFQRHFAEAPTVPSLVDVPTGLGKTAMAVLGWVWRRRFADQAMDSTPRRLVYCLPMRVLVEQTEKSAREWIANLKSANLINVDVLVHVLMGGEDEDEWDIHPERDAIIIGTQDMLLSRALNRGYAASRARWPIQFGMLHTDCLWVFDEIQLMGSGLATTAQLEAFRHRLGSKDGHGCRSVWMSATLRPDWLKTVNFKDRVDGLPQLGLDADDHENDEVKRRWNAQKSLKKSKAVIGETDALAAEVLDAHEPGSRTIVVVNTVKRAYKLHREIAKQWGSADTKRLVLLHSRFRPGDRKRQIDAALADPPDGGTIIVSTQVIEAGVDMSATTLFTELAPWASLVQRFGRCNRRGEDKASATVRWIDLPDKDAAPYESADLTKAREQLQSIEKRPEESERNVGLRWLPEVPMEHKHTHVIRKRDLIDLFDTTPDLAGNDIDIDRFVREVEDSDVRVFWRNYQGTPNETDEKNAEPAPQRDELCPVPIGSDKNPGFRQFARKHGGKVWRWNFTHRTWDKVTDVGLITPGQVYLVHVDAGGYSTQRGWTGDSKDQPTLDYAPKPSEKEAPESNEDDRDSQIGVWQTIDEHTDEVCEELEKILNVLSLSEIESGPLRQAARWHDWGKGHGTFQDAVKTDGRPTDCVGCRVVAKAPKGFWQRYERKHFRHELASALAVLQHPDDPTHSLRDLSTEALNLVAYLIAAHHGKVRLSIRSMPNELWPRDEDGRRLDGCRFARGVWDKDKLGAKDKDSNYRLVDLGGGVIAPVVTLSLEPMELGLCEGKPLECFKGLPSWAERMIGLRDAPGMGPFRLAYLEAILRAADMRASRAAESEQRANHEPTPAEATHG